MEIPTSRESKCQMDFILKSENIVNYVRQSTIQDFGEMCRPDHINIIIDIDI